MNRPAVLGCALALALLAAQPAGACETVPFEFAKVSFPRTDFAAVMFERAAHVDIVVAEQATPVDPAALLAKARAATLAEASGWRDRTSVGEAYDDYARVLRRNGAATVGFRIVERLKGAGPDRFSMVGYWRKAGDADAPAALKGDPLDPVNIYWWNAPAELSPPPVCRYPLRFTAGHRYLMFRDAAGGLLRGSIPAVFGTTTGQRDGYPLWDLTGGDERWLTAVRQAAVRQAAAR